MAYRENSDYVLHFGIRIDPHQPSARLAREHYAAINQRSSIKTYKDWLKYGNHPSWNQELIVDHENQAILYPPAWCKQHQQNCLRNFDINMERFAAVDEALFEEQLQRFTKNRKFQQIFSLEEPISMMHTHDDDVDLQGFMYIMVLDRYKQAYIGMTETSVKQRIKEHWKKKMPFDRLIWGSPETSVLSINSFGPLDTTRIFVKPYPNKLKTPLILYEDKCIKLFGKQFLLNRL